jgi:type IV pilus assembly protein PilB
MKAQKTQTRRSFLEFIVEKGILSQEQLEELLSDIGEIPETRLREALSRRYMIPEEEIYVAWAEYLGLPYIDLRLIAFDAEALTMIPSDFARHNCLIPFSFYPGEISVAFDDLNVNVIDQLKKQTGCDVLIHIAMRSRILEAIEDHYGAIDIEMAAKAVGLSLHSADMLGSREAAEIGPVVDISEGVIVNALKNRASDIHIEPRDDHLQIRFRIDGVLHDRYKLERNIGPPLVSRYKIMAKLDIAEKRIPQDGRIQDVFGGRHIDIRMSVIPTIFGEKGCSEDPGQVRSQPGYRRDAVFKADPSPDHESHLCAAWGLLCHRTYWKRENHNPVCGAQSYQQHRKEYCYHRRPYRVPVASNQSDPGQL